MEETGKNPIQVAERLFQVIERLAENGPMGIMDLSAELGFHKSTTCLLYTSQDRQSGSYQDRQNSQSAGQDAQTQGTSYQDRQSQNRCV